MSSLKGIDGTGGLTVFPPSNALAPPLLLNPVVSFQHPMYVYPEALASGLAEECAALGLKMCWRWAADVGVVKQRRI